MNPARRFDLCALSPRRRVGLLLLLGCLCTVAAEVGALDWKVIPTENCRGLWILPITFGDQPDQTLVMVFDTGASHSSVDPDSIERVRGRRVRPGKKITLKGGRAGPLKVNKLPVKAHHMDHLSRAIGRPIDGILGHPVFGSMLLTLDYPARELRVAEGSLPAVDGRTIFRDLGKNRPYLELEVDGTKLPVLVDSGSLSPLTLRETDAVPWETPPVPISAAVRYDGIRFEKAGRSAVDLSFGPLTLSRPIIETMADKGTRLAGEPILRRFVWTFDQKTRRIRMLAEDEAPLVAPSQRGMGVASRPIEAGLEVVRVFAGSAAAEAGIREGDLVTAIDGVSVYERGCDRPDADNIEGFSLTLVRDGTEHVLPVANPILVP